MIERMPRLGMGTWHMGERESRQLITDREQRSPVLLERFTPPPQPHPAGGHHEEVADEVDEE